MWPKSMWENFYHKIGFNFNRLDYYVIRDLIFDPISISLVMMKFAQILKSEMLLSFYINEDFSM